jgi:hypothetical protein
MKPALDKWYRVSELLILNVIMMVIKGHHLSSHDLKNLRLINKSFSTLIPKVSRWLQIDFSPLLEPRYNYKQQEHINTSWVEMASAAMIHFGLDPGEFVPFLGGEYTGYTRDIDWTLSAVKNHISPEDLAHMKRILLDGCPAELTFDKPLSNKMEMISRGNSKSLNKNLEIGKKIMNKEGKFSHIVPLDILTCLLSPHLRHTMQTMVLKEGKHPHLCYNASTTKKPTDIIMNQITLIAQEAPITFGRVKIQMYINIYTTRISYPLAVIFLAMGDIKACFQFTRIHADLTGASSFIVDDYNNLATSMVFGSTASALSWELFRQAIETLLEVYANQPDLVSKQKKYLDMIGLVKLNPNTPIPPVVACNINTGIVAVDGTEKDLPVQIYVDDVLLLGHSKWQVMMKLAALIEAIFVVMDEPDTVIRQCPLAMDKWEELVVGPVQTMLGLVINTYQLTAGIPSNYVNKVILLLNNTWHYGCKKFTVSKAQKLTGKLGHLTQGATWIFHLLSHLYVSIVYALSENK